MILYQSEANASGVSLKKKARGGKDVGNLLKEDNLQPSFMPYPLIFHALPINIEIFGPPQKHETVNGSWVFRGVHGEKSVPFPSDTGIYRLKGWSHGQIYSRMQILRICKFYSGKQICPCDRKFSTFAYTQILHLV